MNLTNITYPILLIAFIIFIAYVIYLLKYLLILNKAINNKKPIIENLKNDSQSLITKYDQVSNDMKNNIKKFQSLLPVLFIIHLFSKNLSKSNDKGFKKYKNCIIDTAKQACTTQLIRSN